MFQNVLETLRMSWNNIELFKYTKCSRQSGICGYALEGYIRRKQFCLGTLVKHQADFSPPPGISLQVDFFQIPWGIFQDYSKQEEPARQQDTGIQQAGQGPSYTIRHSTFDQAGLGHYSRQEKPTLKVLFGFLTKTIQRALLPALTSKFSQLHITIPPQTQQDRNPETRRATRNLLLQLDHVFARLFISSLAVWSNSRDCSHTSNRL